MARFRKKPVEVEAIQFDGNNWSDVKLFVGFHKSTDGYDIQTFNKAGTYLFVQTEGRRVEFDGCAWDIKYVGELWVAANRQWLPIEPGEWIIKDTLGFYPCKDERFREIYDEVGKERVRQQLPVFLPGNNRNWEQVEGIATVTDDGVLQVRLMKPEMADALVDMAKNNVLWQVSFDYRLPRNEMDKINTQFAMEYHDEKTLEKVKAVLDKVESIQYTGEDIVNKLQNVGILFRERR